MASGSVGLVPEYCAIPMLRGDEAGGKGPVLPLLHGKNRGRLL